jgi:hypothetical protein
VSAREDHILEAAGLRVRFFWRADRYAHEIALQARGRWIVALTSVEGSPQDHWPASPPFQSLHVEHREGQPVALLVGMAGASHWSAGAQLDPRLPCVTFDVAARVRAREAVPLGSSYLCSNPEQDRCPLAIEVVGEPSGAVIERAGPLVKVALDVPPDPAPRTIRWVYRVRINR